MSLHILSLETSSAWCGVALLRADGVRADVLVREHQGVQEHSARLLPMIQEVLDEAGIARGALDAIAFGQGPGGFTGLRVACGVAQGLGFALDRPLVPVVSHAAVASQVAADAGRVLAVAMDARMQEVYLAVYRRVGEGDLEPLLAPQLMAAEGLAPWLRRELAAGEAPGFGAGAPALLCGDAAAAYPEAFAEWPLAQRASAQRPTARAVALLAQAAYLRGQTVAPELAAPLYVRDKVAFTTLEREAGAGGNPRAAAAGARP